MNLSFREQTAIAFVSTPNTFHAVMSPKNAVTLAQQLADECCTAWGHDIMYQHDATENGDNDNPDNHYICYRCGKRGESRDSFKQKENI